ncbi:hypothetical protein [Corynebacterium aurimucosum]|uniref:hypothetical protein n=1 Tax=Corynebacterium aurimucosum TaxID=169292 RepID=UPI0029D412AD|nr:hypothetical protein [Corynebacterium aurimucosum]
MNALQTFLNALGAGIDVIAECEGMSEADLIAAGSPDKNCLAVGAAAHELLWQDRHDQDAT